MSDISQGGSRSSTPEFRYPGADDEEDHPLNDPLGLNTPVATHEEDSDDEFRYPGAHHAVEPSPLEFQPAPPSTGTEPAEEVVHPPELVVEPTPEAVPPPVEAPKPSIVTHEQLEAIASASTTGNLEQLQHLFHQIIQETGCQSFVLANDAAPRTGLTALHHAASRGHLSIVEWRKLRRRVNRVASHILTKLQLFGIVVL